MVVNFVGGTDVGDDADDDGAPSGSARDNCELSHAVGRLLQFGQVVDNK